jgi:hypothetical protein
MDHGTVHAPDDLTRSYPGRVVGHEAARRRAAHGPGADRNWRVGADGEQRAAALLESLTAQRRRRDRLLHRPPSWRVLHSVPLDGGRADIDHVLVGPPGVCTVNTRHHRGGLVELDGETLVVDGVRTAAVPDARREAGRARALLVPRLPPALRTVPVRPVVALVGAAMTVRRWPDDVIVATEGALVAALRGLTPVLDAWAVGEVYALARRAGTWCG